jgi:dTDP-4-amino-4,6-dideoxy-D-galactose acyltransferase
MIRELKWDSNFFNKRIAKLEIKKDEDKNVFEEISPEYDLTYVFSNFEIKALENFHIDTKIILSKSIFKPFKKALNTRIMIEKPECVKEFENEDLYELAYVSGHKSRFKLDSKFSDEEFKLLYRKWIDNSLQDLKTIVYIALINNSIIGFIACKLEQRSANITLVAVDPEFHGKGVGKLLIHNLENYLKEKDIKELYVATQSSNLQAIKFYNQIGFVVFSKTEIYHVWKTK